MYRRYDLEKVGSHRLHASFVVCRGLEKDTLLEQSRSTIAKDFI